MTEAAMTTRLALERVTSMPAEDDTQRGQKVLAASSGMLNIKADYIVEYVRDLLESGYWRSYTYPNGEHYEWLPSEFDYFLSAHQFDPAVIDHAVRSSGDRELVLGMADACRRPEEPGRRRSLDEVRAIPYVGPHIERFTLGGSNVHDLASKPDARQAYLSGTAASRAVTDVRKWAVTWTGDRTPAQVIAEKLLKDPELAHEVLNALRSATRSDSGTRKDP